MACDGDIASEEVEKIKKMPHFSDMDIHQKLEDYIARLKGEGSLFLKKYLDEVKGASLTEEEECRLVDIAIKIIEVDQKVEYNEVAFFKKIRKRLKATDEVLLKAIPENPIVVDQISPEDYLLPDISDEDDLTLWNNTFM
ncbi:MAG: TerB family tellurite resistance protein [Bacteroidales bacterium]|nr:TerB family tellurite resistance protein [Bacteroidales bacterium]